MTPAEEITTAAATISVFAGPAAEPIAKLLREIASLHEEDGRPERGGCDWCGDEDWPCNGFRNALSVARAINEGARQS